MRANINVDLSKNLTFGANISTIINNQQHTTVATWINFQIYYYQVPLWLQISQWSDRWW